MKEKLKIDLVTRSIVIPSLKMWIGKVDGLDNLPKDRAFILAPNHSSYLEHFLIGTIVVPYLGKKICYIAKKEHYDDQVQKFWHKHWTKYVPQIPIDRNKGEEALKTAVSYLKKGSIIVIYPEGTRTLDGKIQKGKTGVARLAIWANVPVVPLGIVGTFKILPKGKIIPRLKKAHFSFGKPIYFKEYYKKKMTKKMLDKATTKIMKEIGKLSNQEYNHE